MTSLTKKEREALLILFKDFTSFYNANSISRILKISHAGAQKLLKRFLHENLVVSQTIGKTIIYRLNFREHYVSQLISFLLADEANSFKRWKEEFKELFKKGRIIMFFGSAVKDYIHAQDIDLMIIAEPNEAKEINTILRKREEILPKKIHHLLLTKQDLLENLKKKNTTIINIVKNAIVLYGQGKYTEILKDAMH